jgi:hypothetical protein
MYLPKQLLNTLPVELWIMIQSHAKREFLERKLFIERHLCFYRMFRVGDELYLKQCETGKIYLYDSQQ